nr:hypothetical protein [Thalassobacillus sp. C254]
MRERLLQAIKDYFTLEIGRPEILNRIGDNIVVFDYIREEVALLILEYQLKKVAKSLKEQRNIELEISEEAREFIAGRALENTENGGRGIGNVVESSFINPLSRYMYDHEVKENKNVKIVNIRSENQVIHLECEVDDV